MGANMSKKLELNKDGQVHGEPAEEECPYTLNEKRDGYLRHCMALCLGSGFVEISEINNEWGNYEKDD